MHGAGDTKGKGVLMLMRPVHCTYLAFADAVWVHAVMPVVVTMLLHYYIGSLVTRDAHEVKAYIQLRWLQPGSQSCC